MKNCTCTLSPSNIPMFSKTLLATLSGFACLAHGQSALLSNGSTNPAVPALAALSTTGNSTPAPGGSFWSEVASQSTLLGNSLAGIACNSDASDPSGGLRVSDDFVVPEGETWNLSTLDLYAYQLNANLSINAGTLRIWNGPPNVAGSVIVFGDTTTNRLQQVQATTTYRVFTTTVGPAITSPDTSRRVHRVSLSAQTSLPAGTYWLDWQLQPLTPAIATYVVPVTLPGSRSTPTWNAKQYADGAWLNVVDTGKPDISTDSVQDVAFILSGTITVACDSIDFNQDTLFPDDNDLVDFLSVLAGGPCTNDPNCNDIDFNNDGLFPDDNDLISFLTVLAGGAC